MGTKRRLPKTLTKKALQLFPKLKHYTVTSPKDTVYNCIAFVAGDLKRKWEPILFPSPGYYWPAVGAYDPDSVAGLIELFESLGYQRCENSELEPGIRKIAIYAIPPDNWTHAAIQTETGDWVSKLGVSYDIRHLSAYCLEGPLYGTVVAFLSTTQIDR